MGRMGKEEAYVGSGVSAEIEEELQEREAHDEGHCREGMELSR